MSRIETIYIELLEEGTPCFRPAQAEHLGEDLYRIVGEKPEDEIWAFSTGDIVECRIHTFAGGSSGLLAYTKADPSPPFAK
jgi:hypothetical protein